MLTDKQGNRYSLLSANGNWVHIFKIIGIKNYKNKISATTQCPRTDLNKRSLPRPETTTA